MEWHGGRLAACHLEGNAEVACDGFNDADTLKTDGPSPHVPAQPIPQIDY